MANYDFARSLYSDFGVDTEEALRLLATTPLSLHCWQGDDVRGFEHGEAPLSSGGIQATGNYPGRARNADDLRSDLDVALRALPGRHRVNLHALYAETSGARVDRDRLEASHFERWLDWAAAKGLGLDFNPSFFSHPLADGGYTLSSADDRVRTFWIQHARACREIGAAFGRRLGSPCVVNLWIPDGEKENPVDRAGPRLRLASALDEVFSGEPRSPHLIDSLESKLFGIGSESYVVGSHEFYLGYAIRNQKWLCLDMGHFHPTESVADKVSSLLPFVPGLLLHLSRGVRWDSDHVVLLDDATKAVLSEVVRSGHLARVRLGLDYFDASINRIAAWIIGARNAQKALLAALLEPAERLRSLERGGNRTERLALLEELKTLPLGLVWQEHCERCGAPGDGKWLDEIKRYERDVLSTR